MQHVIQFLHTQTYTHLTFTYAIRHKTPSDTKPHSSQTHSSIYTHTPSGSCTTPLVNEALYRQVHNTHTHTHTHKHNLGHKTQNFRHRNSSPHLNIQPHTSLWVGTPTQNSVSHTHTPSPPPPLIELRTQSPHSGDQRLSHNQVPLDWRNKPPDREGIQALERDQASGKDGNLPTGRGHG